jgi:hypothetical protein
LSSIAGFIYFYEIEKLEKTIPKFTLRAILTFFSLMIAILFFICENYLYGDNYLTMNMSTGVFGWVFSIPYYIFVIFVVGNAGWLFGRFTKRQVAVILLLEPLMGQYIAINVIKIDLTPPSISIIGGLVCVIGMYIIYEAYFGTFKRTPKYHHSEEKRLEALKDCMMRGRDLVGNNEQEYSLDSIYLP